MISNITSSSHSGPTLPVEDSWALLEQEARRARIANNQRIQSTNGLNATRQLGNGNGGTEGLLGRPLRTSDRSLENLAAISRMNQSPHLPRVSNRHENMQPFGGLMGTGPTTAGLELRAGTLPELWSSRGADTAMAQDAAKGATGASKHSVLVPEARTVAAVVHRLPEAPGMTQAVRNVDINVVPEVEEHPVAATNGEVNKEELKKINDAMRKARFSALRKHLNLPRNEQKYRLSRTHSSKALERVLNNSNPRLPQLDYRVDRNVTAVPTLPSRPVNSAMRSSTEFTEMVQRCLDSTKRPGSGSPSSRKLPLSSRRGLGESAGWKEFDPMRALPFTPLDGFMGRYRLPAGSVDLDSLVALAALTFRGILPSVGESDDEGAGGVRRAGGGVRRASVGVVRPSRSKSAKAQRAEEKAAAAQAAQAGPSEPAGRTTKQKREEMKALNRRTRQDAQGSLQEAVPGNAGDAEEKSGTPGDESRSRNLEAEAEAEAEGVDLGPLSRLASLVVDLEASKGGAEAEASEESLESQVWREIQVETTKGGSLPSDQDSREGVELLVFLAMTWAQRMSEEADKDGSSKEAEKGQDGDPGPSNRRLSSRRRKPRRFLSASPLTQRQPSRKKRHAVRQKQATTPAGRRTQTARRAGLPRDSGRSSWSSAEERSQEDAVPSKRGRDDSSLGKMDAEDGPGGDGEGGNKSEGLEHPLASVAVARQRRRSCRKPTSRYPPPQEQQNGDKESEQEVKGVEKVKDTDVDLEKMDSVDQDET